MNPEIEITTYDKSLASTEEIKKIFYKNIADTSNISSFSGVHLSLKMKYGKFAYVILLLPSLVFIALSAIPCLIVTDWPITISTILSIILSALLSFWLFGHFFVKRNFNMFMDIARKMLPNFDDMDKRYSKTGGQFFVALAHNKETGRKEIAGTLGLVNLQAVDPTLVQKTGYMEAVGVNIEYRKYGIAKKLVEKSLEFAENNKFEVINLRTMQVNTGGRTLYGKFGFKLTETLEIEPITGLSVIHMQKKLV